MDCLSVKHLRKNDKDGEYTVRVFARDNSKTELGIYCHEMNTSKPKEFLTLPAGVHHNYVRVKTNPKCKYNQTDPGNFLPTVANYLTQTFFLNNHFINNI